jgi:hypothetical protein
VNENDDRAAKIGPHSDAKAYDRHTRQAAHCIVEPSRREHKRDNGSSHSHPEDEEARASRSGWET